MKFRNGSAAFSTIVGVACLAAVGSAGYSMVTGESVCSLLGSCDTVVVATASATTTGESHCGASATREAALVAMVAEASCETKASCDEAKSTTAWTMAEDGAVVVPAALVSAEGGACAGDAAKCASDAKIVNAAETKQCADASSCSDAGDVQVVTAALVTEGPECGPECGDEPCAECAAKAAEAADADVVAAFKPVNATCPGSGEPVDPAVASVHQGFTVGFCCGGCQKKFDAKSDDEKTVYVVKNATVVNEMCPTCPTMKPSETSVSLFNGFAVGFCGDHCKSTFEKKDDAGKTAYIASIVKPVNAECPFSGEPIDAEVVTAYRGFTVAFCCNGCQGRFAEKITAAERDGMVAKLALAKGGAMVVPAGEAMSCGEACGDDCDENCEDMAAAKSKPGE